jgi:hypothetical protein
MQALIAIKMTLAQLVDHQASQMLSDDTKRMPFLRLLINAGLSGKIPQLESWAAAKQAEVASSKRSRRSTAAQSPPTSSRLNTSCLAGLKRKQPEVRPA